MTPKEKMYRVTLTFKNKKVPPGHNTTYVQATSPTEAQKVAMNVHKHEYGGVKNAIAREIR